MEDWQREYNAPTGQIWVCSACGKHGPNRVRIGDESCFMNAVLCYEEKVDGIWYAVDEEKGDTRSEFTNLER